MACLLLQLVAPMQSWGIGSHFSNRDSGMEPSKSGVIGIICAALGIDRKADLSAFAGLRMGVRIDRQGILMRDFQTVREVYTLQSTKLKNIITNRYYLSDAAFLVGLEGDDLALLERIQYGLKHPVWEIFLGRKAFPPALPVWMEGGLRAEQTLEQALADCGWIVQWKKPRAPEKVMCVVEDPQGEQIRNDVPVSFEERTFLSRRIRAYPIDSPAAIESGA